MPSLTVASVVVDSSCSSIENSSGGEEAHVIGCVIVETISTISGSQCCTPILACSNRADTVLLYAICCVGVVLPRPDAFCVEKRV